MAPRPGEQSVQLWADPDLVAAVDEVAKVAGVSRSELVRRVLASTALALAAEVAELDDLRPVHTDPAWESDASAAGRSL